MDINETEKFYSLFSDQSLRAARVRATASGSTTKEIVDYVEKILQDGAMVNILRNFHLPTSLLSWQLFDFGRYSFDHFPGLKKYGKGLQFSFKDIGKFVWEKYLEQRSMWTAGTDSVFYGTQESTRLVARHHYDREIEPLTQYLSRAYSDWGRMHSFMGAWIHGVAEQVGGFPQGELLLYSSPSLPRRPFHPEDVYRNFALGALMTAREEMGKDLRNV